MQRSTSTHHRHAVARSFPLWVLLSAWTVTAVADTTAYVINEASQDISVIDADSNTVVATIAGLLSPVGIHPADAGDEVYVASYLDFVGDDGVRIYETASNAEIGRVHTGVGFNTLQITSTADGSRLFASNQAADSISVIHRPSLQVIDSFMVGAGPIGIDLTPDEHRLLVANASDDTVSILDAATGASLATLAVGAFPNQVVVHPSGLTAYTTNISDNSVSVLYLAQPSVVATVAVGGAPLALAISPAGDEAWVLTSAAGAVEVIDLADNVVVATVDVGTDPLGVRFSPDGEQVYVSNAADDTVSVIDTLARSVVDTIDVGDNPSDLTFVGQPTVGGLTTGLTNLFALCQNRTTGQSTVIPLAGASTWDCEAAGLAVNGGDTVQQIIRGTVH